jgi:hypothetical protein
MSGNNQGRELHPAVQALLRDRIHHDGLRATARALDFSEYTIAKGAAGATLSKPVAALMESRLTEARAA